MKSERMVKSKPRGCKEYPPAIPHASYTGAWPGARHCQNREEGGHSRIHVGQPQLCKNEVEVAKCAPTSGGATEGPLLSDGA